MDQFLCPHNPDQLSPYRGGWVCECGVVTALTVETNVDQRGIINCNQHVPIGPGVFPRPIPPPPAPFPGIPDDMLPQLDDILKQKPVEQGPVDTRRNPFSAFHDGACLYVPAPGATKQGLVVEQRDQWWVDINWTYRKRSYSVDAKLPENHIIEYVTTEHGMVVLHLKAIPQEFPRKLDVRG